MTANTILSITNTGIDLMFNAVSGVLLAVLYTETIFLVNSLINLAALITAVLLFRGLALKKSLSADKTKRKAASLKEAFRGYREDLKRGLAFVQNQTILSLIIPLVGLSLFYAMMLVNLPAFSANVFGSSIGYGLTLTMLAVGSIIGAALSGRFTKRFRLGRLFPLLFLFGGMSWVLMALLIKPMPVLGLLFLITAAAALGAVNIIFGTIFQQMPPENMIGRVNTVNLSLIAVASLLGSLLGGVVAKLSADFVPFLLCGMGYLLIAFIMKINIRVSKLPIIDEVNQNIL